MDSNINIEEIMNIYENSTDGAIRFIVRTYGLDEKEASDIVYAYYGKIMSDRDSELYNRIQNKNEKVSKQIAKECNKEDAKQRREIREENRNRHYENLMKLSNSCAVVSGKDKVARCHKCKSASISYGGNRPSLGRAAVGGVLAGAAGATIGGLTGKKGYAVCLNCGKRWKI